MTTPEIVTISHYVASGFLLWISSAILPYSITDLYTFVSCTLLWLIIANFTVPISKNRFLNARVTPCNKAVLITGCDSGFGYNLAKRLDTRGFTVFASCLLPTGDGATSLKKNCSDRVHVFGLDVTKDESVEKALEYVKQNLGKSELWAVVNNAGVYEGFDVAWTPLDKFRVSLEVNTLGVVRVTKAFLSLLQASRGRVVTVTSLAGRISCSHISAYSMSKYAAVSFCECLRQEMQPWGVKVISVEPEFFRTPMTSMEYLCSKIDTSWNPASEETKSDYGEKYISDFKKYLSNQADNISPKIYRVIDDLYDAISLEEPYPVYKPNRNLAFQILVQLYENLPKPIVDLTIRFYKYLTGFPTPKEAENTL